MTDQQKPTMSTNAQARSEDVVLETIWRKAGPYFIQKLPSLFPFSFQFSYFNTFSPSHCICSWENSPVAFLDGPWLWAPGQFPWFPDTVHHQHPDGRGVGGVTGRQERESRANERTRVIKHWGLARGGRRGGTNGGEGENPADLHDSSFHHLVWASGIRIWLCDFFFP